MVKLWSKKGNEVLLSGKTNMEVESDKETGLERAETPMKMSALSVLYVPVTAGFGEEVSM